MEDYKILNLDDIREKAKSFIEDFILNGTWYEWYDDDCPYDRSGETKKLSIPKIEYIQELESKFFYSDPLSQIYLGDWTATFESGYGKHHRTLCDLLVLEIIDPAVSKFVSLNIGDVPEDTNEYYDLCDDISYSDFAFDIYGIEEELCSYYDCDKIIEILKKHR